MSSLAAGVLTAGLLAATVIDLRSRRIPNVLTATMIGVGIGLAAAGAGGATLGAALAGLTLGFMLMLPGYALGATGAGDVKLMAAVGSLVGPALVVYAFLCTAIVGGALAIVVAARRRRFRTTLIQTGRLVASPAAAPQQIRAAAPVSRFAYGPAIAAGSLVAVLMA
jgi:prepilin peptidase CpaA